MVLNVTFNNISVILWRSVSLLEEIGVVEENHRPAASHCDKSVISPGTVGSQIIMNVIKDIPVIQALYYIQ